jgi:hypothetical protein|tara:strand:+ start:125 stop:568 length:444 start_codon:yes stop_codon:yes gene_type:complete
VSRKEFRIMKNKIYKLYEPNSLKEFLEFYKKNPNEKFVYVIQHPPERINILSASDFGHLVICLSNTGSDSQVVYSTGPALRKLQKCVKEFRKQDYLLAIGDPMLLVLAGIAINDVTNGQFNQIKWNNKTFRYFPLEVDVYNKGGQDG